MVVGEDSLSDGGWMMVALILAGLVRWLPMLIRLF